MKLITACLFSILFSILLTCVSITCAQELTDFDKPNKVDQLSSGISAPSAKRQARENESMLSRLNKEPTNKPQATIASDTGKISRWQPPILPCITPPMAITPHWNIA